MSMLGNVQPELGYMRRWPWVCHSLTVVLIICWLSLFHAEVIHSNSWHLYVAFIRYLGEVVDHYFLGKLGNKTFCTIMIFLLLVDWFAHYEFNGTSNKM